MDDACVSVGRTKFLCRCRIFIFIFFAHEKRSGFSHVLTICAFVSWRNNTFNFSNLSRSGSQRIIQYYHHCLMSGMQKPNLLRLVKEFKPNCSRNVLNIYDHTVAVGNQKRDVELLTMLQSAMRTNYHAAHVLDRKPSGSRIKVRHVPT